VPYPQPSSNHIGNKRLIDISNTMTIIIVNMARVVYRLIFAQQLFDHLRVIPRKHHAAVQIALESLMQQPATPTRNRKALRVPNTFNASWELRFGEANEFRTFYQILPDEAENEFIIFVIAVGFKEGNKLVIGLEEVTL